MKTILIYFGSGALFGMGACFGVAISAFCVSMFRTNDRKDMKDFQDKLMLKWSENISALNEIAGVIEDKKVS